MNILCIGAVLCDIAIKPVGPDAFSARRIDLDSLDINGGGDANNAATDLAILGEKVRLVSRVGSDFLGDHLVARLRETGVDTRDIVRAEDAPTTASVLMLSNDGSVVISARHAGASDALTASDVADEALAWADHVHAVNVLNMPALDGEGLCDVFERAHRAGATTSMDLKRPRKAQARPMDLIEGALRHCDVFLPSNYEIAYLLGETGVAEARDVFSKYGLKVFGVKRGEKGAYVTDFREAFYQPSLFEGVPADVIGAGDAFSSTFVAAWKRALPLRDCALLASAASAYVLSAVGATTGMKPMAELAAFVEKRAGRRPAL